LAWQERFSATTFSGTIAKLLLLGVSNALAISALPQLWSARAWQGLVAVALATVAIDVVYLSGRHVPLKYLLPGTLFLLSFQAYPVVYNAYVAFTNFGTGNILTQDQALEQVLRRSVAIPEDAVRYAATPLVDDAGSLAVLLVAPDGSQQLGTPDGLSAVDPADVVIDGSRVASVGPWRRLTLGQATDREDEVLGFRVPTGEGEIRLQSFTQAALAEQLLVHDPATDTLTNTQDGAVYLAAEGFYRTDDGQRLTPGWRVFVGFENFNRVLGSEAIRGPFLRVFAWTFVFAVLSVLLTFALGLFLAITLNDPRVRGLKYYRAVMIIPYALPSFMTALIWAGLLNQDFGIVNRLLGTDVNWLGDPWLAKASILLVNTWLGFPYMFLISLGALQAIPTDLREAAFIDGASGYKAFRFVTLPLVLVATGPILISSFAFNFNNFNVIYLLTGGGPPIVGAQTPAGHTDILISYTYRLAFETGRGNDWGLASAVAVLIFLIVALFSIVSFRQTRALEEVN